MNRNSSAKIIYLLLLLMTILFLPLIAQEDDMEEMEETPCKPETLTTIYDTHKESNVNPQQIGIWYDYARQYYKLAKYGGNPDNYKDAIPYYWKVIVNDSTPTFKTAYSRLVDCYLHFNQVDSALIVIYRGLERFPNYATLHYQAGQIQRTLGKAQCAIPHYEKLIELGSKDPKVLKNYWMILAQLYFQMEDERAIEAQQKVVELDPQDVEAATLLAHMMDQMGMNSLEALEKAYKLDPTNIANARRFGKAAFEANEYQKAMEAFRAILKQDPKNIEALTYIARSYEALEQLSSAIKTYKQILQIDPKNLNTLCALADVYSRMNQFKTARSYVQKALRINPNYGLAYMVMGSIYENAVSYCSGKRAKPGYTYDDKLVFERAIAEYQKAAKRDPNVISSAQSRIKMLEPFKRTKEEIFLHNKRTKINDPCYEWIQ
ncbi:MAG: hypothetical protein D6748_06650 [Calditrichaeota bacterium]|nr:MAG: hypothetical protein D6748_06650 [Calditrichota bacterium]